MARPRSVPDQIIHTATLELIRLRGEKAVTFSAVAQRVGLAASTLAERHGSIAGLIADARRGSWQGLEAATATAIAAAGPGPKGAVALLKAIDATCKAEVAADPDRARDWRVRLETELALRLGAGAKGREAAAILFAFWQGQQFWLAAGCKPAVRLKDVVKRLTA